MTVPETLIHALLITEDKRFPKHRGVDIIALCRAFLACIRTRRFSQGGSTITMQLARTLFLDGRRTISRKIKEMKIAIELEREHTKVEILQMYMASVYMGPVSGFHKASRYYFSKEMDQLSLREQIALVALLAAPNRLKPNTHPAMIRQMMIADKMLDRGLISEIQHFDVHYQIAEAQEIHLTPNSVLGS